MSTNQGRVLIVGRSTAVLLDAVALLRGRGYAANASNQFDQLLTDYDFGSVDLVVFGGMVPPEKKERLQEQILAVNPHVTFLPGLGGVAPLLAAQIEQFFCAVTPEFSYDATSRVLHVTTDTVAKVAVQGIWGTFVPPEPVGHEISVFEAELDAGRHAIPIPPVVPSESSFVAVRVGDGVAVRQIGATPQAVRALTPGSLPVPEPISTRLPWM
ncbi:MULTISPECIES: hypothetical protein [unclassified Microbacterium]|uniref:hypothetical protein n=1 Tax=unclassified Microbacterium TaxID=2609290 RepID=UPI0012F85686|nr:hypothetical protein [Microbacterium sp. MAH-37]MVQ40697.1 hypothetical protein [Microbacterium sp. MAH-37]